jgi:hypothetical protein
MGRVDAESLLDPTLTLKSHHVETLIDSDGLNTCTCMNRRCSCTPLGTSSEDVSHLCVRYIVIVFQNSLFKRQQQ